MCSPIFITIIHHRSIAHYHAIFCPPNVTSSSPFIQQLVAAFVSCQFTRSPLASPQPLLPRFDRDGFFTRLPLKYFAYLRIASKRFAFTHYTATNALHPFRSQCLRFCCLRLVGVLAQLGWLIVLIVFMHGPIHTQWMDYLALIIAITKLLALQMSPTDGCIGALVKLRVGSDWLFRK